MIDFIPESVIGQVAGITTSLLWVATSMFFTAGGKRIGATFVNTVRIFIAIIILGTVNWILFGMLLPEIPGRQWSYLAVSGVIGLAIGDQALFLSFLYIGPRLAVLIMSTSPLWAVIFGWVALGEHLGAAALFGIGLTVFGVGWVTLERDGKIGIKEGAKGGGAARHHLWGRGVALALTAALCQAVGALLSKQGMGHGFMDGAGVRIEPLTATFVRMVFAGVGVLPIVLIRWRMGRKAAGKVGERVVGEVGTDRAIDETRKSALRGKGMGGRMGGRRWRSGLLFTLAGAVFGPFLGVWMSLVALDHAPVGIAQTLCSLSPIFILPVVVVVNRERVSLRAVIGACVAVGGVAILVMGG